MSTSMKAMTRLFVITLMLVAPSLLYAQEGLDPQKILKPLGEQWLTYSGDYTGKRYSSLQQINRENVHNLSLAWVNSFRAGTGASGTADGGLGSGGRGAFPTIVGGLGTGDLNVGGPARLSGAILQVDGILYVTAPDNAWAVDARDGSIIWHYYWKTRGGTHTGNRGVGMYGNWLFMEMHDDMLVSLDARTGKERWHKEIANFDAQYFSSSAPIVIGRHVLVGTGNDLDAPGMLQSFDPETGERQWISYTVPMKANDPGAKTWASLDAARHGGGHTWVPGSYDPETHLYIFGTGNPTPAFTTGRGEGDNLFTCSLIALDVETGKMAWYYQTSPHDTHDWDATRTPVLVDAPFDGRPRKLVMQATTNGYFFVLDRVTGEHLLTGKLGEVNNWARNLDAQGQPRRDPQKDATVAGSLVNSEVTGRMLPATFSPDTGLFYSDEGNSLQLTYLTDADPRGSMGLAGTTSFVSRSLDFGAAIIAVDYQNGKVVWRHRTHGTGGLLSTAGRLLFGNDGTYLVAYDAFTGTPLWHVRIGANGTAPETYAVDGQQYILAMGEGQLFAFVLNQPVSGRASH
jgi:alcohol dehydrogenase (cytochrome c)